MFQLAAIFLMALISAAAAQSGGATPIRYSVAENNRLFLNGDGDRFVEDLHRYLRCTDKNTRPDLPDCVTYMKEGTARVGGKDVVVPNLRNGADETEYQVRYDKAAHTYPARYARDGRRRVSFALDKAWRDQQPTAPINCNWRVIAADKTFEAVSRDCTPVSFDVDLSLSGGGDRLSWSASAELALDAGNGKTLQFADNQVMVRDILIVALGDSYTAGEGNPERNRTPTMPAQWLDYRCHRSAFSYPVMASAALALADPRHSVTLIHVACSGAQSHKGVLKAYEGALSKAEAELLWRGAWGLDRWRRSVPAQWRRYGTVELMLRSQLSQVSDLLAGVDGAPPRRPEVLLMSVGVNDIGLAQLIEKLAKKDCVGDCVAQLRRWREVEAEACAGGTDPLRRSFGCLEQRLGEVRAAIDKDIAPQRAYLMQYLDPLRDDKDEPCMSDPKHSELLGEMLGPLESWVGWIWSPKLSLAEIRYSGDEFFAQLKRALVKTAGAPGWKLLVHRGDETKRGFCARPSWYHKFVEAKQRQYFDPGSRIKSVGTLHPNAFGQYFAAVRVLSDLRKDDVLAGHGLRFMQQVDFSPVPPRADRYHGFAWYIWNKHKEELSRYRKY